jgi:hypothetical protein
MRIAVRVSVALFVILPLLFLLGGGWLTTFAIALVGFGLGRLVERLLLGSPDPREGAWWPLAAFPVLGLLLIGGIEIVEYRLEQRREEARVQVQQMHVPAPVEHIWRVELLPDGSLLSDGKPAALASLVAPEHTVRAEVSARADVPYDQVIAVMDQIRAAGVEDITLAPH